MSDEFKWPGRTYGVKPSWKVDVGKVGKGGSGSEELLQPGKVEGATSLFPSPFLY